MVAKKFFRPFGPHFALKIRGGGGPPGSSPGSATVTWLGQSPPKRRQKKALPAGWGEFNRNYVSTCSLYPHPMLKCGEYKLLFYFLQSRDVSQFYDIKRSKDQSMALSECWDHLYQINSLFFLFPDQAPFDPNAKADKFFINVEVCYVIAQSESVILVARVKPLLTSRAI